MSSEWIQRLIAKSVTPCNPAFLAEVTREAPELKAVTPVTRVTPANASNDEFMPVAPEWTSRRVTCIRCRHWTASGPTESVGKCGCGYQGGLGGTNATLERHCPDWEMER